MQFLEETFSPDTLFLAAQRMKGHLEQGLSKYVFAVILTWTKSGCVSCYYKTVFCLNAFTVLTAIQYKPVSKQRRKEKEEKNNRSFSCCINSLHHNSSLSRPTVHLVSIFLTVSHFGNLLIYLTLTPEQL